MLHWWSVPGDCPVLAALADLSRCQSLGSGAVSADSILSL